MSFLSVENLTKIYGKGAARIHALDHVSFTIEKGEFVAITGKSGCGKTTLMNAISLIDQDVEGEIRYNGEKMESKQQKEAYRGAHIGIVFQFFNLVPVLTVQENIALPYLVHGQKVPEEDMEKALSELGLLDKRHSLPDYLSGGEQQRVAIGRAIITRPSLLIADEPTGNLDSGNTEKIIRLFQMLNEKYHQTIILVTHDGYVSGAASRKIQMMDGKIV